MIRREEKEGKLTVKREGNYPVRRTLARLRLVTEASEPLLFYCTLSYLLHVTFHQQHQSPRAIAMLSLLAGFHDALVHTRHHHTAYLRTVHGKHSTTRRILV